MPTTEIAQMTIVHVEDADAFELLLKPIVQQKGFRYVRVSLLSEAWDYLEDPDIGGFIIDLLLPYEDPAQFTRWAGHESTPEGLIKKIRGIYPDIPIVVLTEHTDDQSLRRLLQGKYIQKEDIFKKPDQRDESLEALVERLQGGRSVGSSQVKRPSTPPTPAVEPASMPLPANMDLRLLHLVEKARRGLLTQETASTLPSEIPVVARVDNLEAWKSLTGVRAGIEIPRPNSRQWIVTGRLQAEQAEAVRRQDFVLSLEAAHLMAPQLSRTLEEVRASGMAELLHEPGMAGKGVVIGFVDEWCDFVHPNFRHEAGQGKTRVLALWHQDAKNKKGPVKFGALHESSDLDAALVQADPYEDYSIPKGAHGTHVMDIASGGGAGTGVPGIAPAADIIFVDLSKEATPWGAETLDRPLIDSVHLLEAVRFIFNWAGDRPCVINLSLGSELGAHDGTSLVELALDDLVAEIPNRAVVVAASNSYELGVHASGAVPQGGFVDLEFQVEEGICAILDLWYKGRDQFAAEILSPAGQSFGRVELGNSRSWPDSKDGLSIKLVHEAQHSDNGDNRIQLFLDAAESSEDWRLRLHGVNIQDGGLFHAWIEGEGGALPHSFSPPHDKTHTLGCLGCGRESIAVGAYNSHDDCKICSYSSAGPTRDGRLKPDLSAPGEHVLAAQSRYLDRLVSGSGTSMAVPVVSGIVAVLLAEAQSLGISLWSHEIREILREASRSNPPEEVWDPRYGWGRIDARSAILALRKRVSTSEG